ncbi:hypothetical protein [Dactylosporangium sp. CA-233914]|uniref:hypothetical protein n=1 Tax=Dactylosporangium sp. CA-233914 TaxID=3239934 RepID=UPI003D906D32
MDGVIDLDVPDRRSVAPLSRRWRRAASMKVPALGVAVLMLFGVAAGAVAGQRWEAARERGRQAAEASLFLAVAGLNSGGGQDGLVIIEGSVAVTNGGPMPVEVAGAENAAVVMVRGQLTLAPAATGWFAASASITCPQDAADAARPLPVGLSVVTADGVRRAVTVQLQLSGSRWYELVAQSCRALR